MVIGNYDQGFSCGYGFFFRVATTTSYLRTKLCHVGNGERGRGPAGWCANMS